MSSITQIPDRLAVQDPSEPFVQTSWRYHVRRGLRSARTLMSDDPIFLPIILRSAAGGTSRAITDETALVIEGYPRSGNTFAYFAMKQAQSQHGRRSKISSHVHTPSQVKLAVRRRVPTLVVVRPPLPTIASLIVAAPHVKMRTAIREYIHHHREILPYSNRFVTATFTQVTTDMGAVTQRLNARFGTDFPLFEPTPENVEATFDAIDARHAKYHRGAESVVARPSAARQPSKDWVIGHLQAPRFEPAMAEADEIYQLLADRAV